MGQSATATLFHGDMRHHVAVDFHYSAYSMMDHQD